MFRNRDLWVKRASLHACCWNLFSICEILFLKHTFQTSFVKKLLVSSSQLFRHQLWDVLFTWKNPFTNEFNNCKHNGAFYSLVTSIITEKSDYIKNMVILWNSVRDYCLFYKIICLSVTYIYTYINFSDFYANCIINTHSHTKYKHIYAHIHTPFLYMMREK